MNLRQKLAWLLMATFLGSTFAFLYYLLDLADQFTLLSLEHSKLHQQNIAAPLAAVDHSSSDLVQNRGHGSPFLLLDPNKAQSFDAQQHNRQHAQEEAMLENADSIFWHHIVDVPAPVLLVFAIILYCQVFAMLYYFTLPHISSMRDINVCIIPFLGWFYIIQRMRTLLLWNKTSAEAFHRGGAKEISYS